MRRALIIVCTLVSFSICSAKYAMPDMHVPVVRLIANVRAKLRKDDRGPLLHYTLARLHSIAYAYGEGRLDVYSAPDEQPGFSFPHYTSVLVYPAPTRDALTVKMGHLQASMTQYRKAVEIAPGVPLYHLGYAWVLEQAALNAKGMHASAGLAKEWVDSALEHYRTTYRLTREQEAAGRGTVKWWDRPDTFLAKEAAECIERMLGPKITPKEKAWLAEGKEKPRSAPITPIVFPLYGGTLASCLSPRNVVNFDLVGDGVHRRWPWVNSGTGILVWDPQSTGKITSGTQLFGSSTFWMFFRNGYDALETLDNDGSGWLSGDELKGICVWVDMNENGRSDPGEVAPATIFGIRAISVQGTEDGGVLGNRCGILWNNLTLSPSYDWMPRAL